MRDGWQKFHKLRAGLVRLYEEDRRDEGKLKAYDALSCFFHLALRIAKANNQRTCEGKDTPCLTLPQIWKLIERVLENPSMNDSKELPPQDIRLLGHVPRQR